MLLFMGFPGGSDGKESACNVGDPGLIPGLGRSPGEEKGYAIQYSWRIPGLYIPWDWEESDTTERLHFHFSRSRIGEGNGNPLQCSCLENPRDGKPGGLPSMGSHSQTRLK